jgi:hypothetical protein
MRKEDGKCNISSILYIPSIIKFEIFDAIHDTRDTYPKRIFHNILYGYHQTVIRLLKQCDFFIVRILIEQQNISSNGKGIHS